MKPLKPLIGSGIGNNKLVRKLIGLLLSVVPRQSVIVEANGCKIEIEIGGGSGLDCLAPGLIFGGGYEPMTTEVFKSMVKPGMTILDVGAHIGYYTLLASKIAGDMGWVFAFEPDPINFAGLERNIELNGFSNITTFKMAVSDYNGKGKLFVSGNFTGERSLIDVKGRPKDNIEVGVEKLDSIIWGKIDIIKIDVDGGEVGVLRGAERIINSNPDIKIITEFWKPGLEAAGFDCATYWFTLRRLGFNHIYLIDEKGQQITRTNLGSALKYVHKQQGVNLLCCKREKA